MFGNRGCAGTVPSIDCIPCGMFMMAVAFGLATLCFAVPRLRDCASANGIAQTANSVRRISALQRRCVLIEEFCFFIVLSVEFGRIPGSNPLPVQMCVHRGKTFVAKSP